MRWVSGIHAANELFKTRPHEITQLLMKKNWQENSSLVNLVKKAQEFGLKYKEVDQGQINKISQSNQGLAVEVMGEPQVDWEAVYKKEKSIILLLDGLEDPHNLGAILRTSWLMGVDAALISTNHSVGLTATVAKVASGGCEHVPLVRENRFEHRITELKENGFWVFGLSLDATENLFEVELPEKIVLVIGAEDKGMRKSTAKLCDKLVKIPQVSQGASFNASVAAGIVLGETIRQHQTP